MTLDDSMGFFLVAFLIFAVTFIMSSTISGCKKDQAARHSSLCYEQTKNEKCWNLNSALQAK